MKKVNVTVLVCGILAMLASFMPMASNDSFYVNINHMGGLTLLPHLIPLFVITVAVFALNNKISNLKAWYLPATIMGLIIASLSAYAGIEHLNSFAGFAGGFSIFNTARGQASIGFGAIILLAAYLTSSIASFLTKKA